MHLEGTFEDVLVALEATLEAAVFVPQFVGDCIAEQMPALLLE